MKNLSKYILFFAALTLGLTACQEEVKREESPVYEGNAVAFAQTSLTREVNMLKEAKEQVVTLYRTKGFDEQFGRR